MSDPGQAFIFTGPNCDGMRSTPCPEGGPPMELARVIYACNCHCTLEEDAPELLQRAPAMLAALRALPDDVDMIEHNPDDGASYFCCGAPVSFIPPGCERSHAPGCWYVAALAAIDGLS